MPKYLLYHDLDPRVGTHTSNKPVHLDHSDFPYAPLTSSDTNKTASTAIRQVIQALATHHPHFKTQQLLRRLPHQTPNHLIPLNRHLHSRRSRPFPTFLRRWSRLRQGNDENPSAPSHLCLSPAHSRRQAKLPCLAWHHRKASLGPTAVSSPRQLGNPHHFPLLRTNERLVKLNWAWAWILEWEWNFDRLCMFQHKVLQYRGRLQNSLTNFQQWNAESRQTLWQEWDWFWFLPFMQYQPHTLHVEGPCSCYCYLVITREGVNYSWHPFFHYSSSSFLSIHEPTYSVSPSLSLSLSLTSSSLLCGSFFSGKFKWLVHWRREEPGCSWKEKVSGTKAFFLFVLQTIS